MPHPIITHDDTRPAPARPLPSILSFPVIYWDVTGLAVEHEEIRARDLSTAVAAASRRCAQHRSATGFHVARGT